MKKRLYCLCSILIGVAVACHSQRIEVSRQTIKGDFDNDRREDWLTVVCKTHYEKGEEDPKTWYFSEITVEGKLVLGNRKTLHFTDSESLDAVIGGELSYFSPHPGIIVRAFREPHGSTVTITYDYYLYNIALHDWYRYKIATYDQATWEEASVAFEYCNKAQKPLVGSKLRRHSTALPDPILPKSPLKYLRQLNERKWYPKYYYDFVSCIEVLNQVDKKIGRKAIEKLVKHLKPHNSTWAHYIVSTYLNRNIRY